LVLAYSILSDICRAKAAELLDDEENLNMEEVEKWKIKAEKYKQLEKDAVLQLNSLELEKGIKTDEESLFSEVDGSDIKKEKKIEDIFDDPGFLEF
jgi:hypothetical protein